MNDKLQAINNLLNFIHSSPTAYHAVSVITDRLRANGFMELDEKAPWFLKQGEGYFVQRNGSSVIAFRMGLKEPAESGFLIGGAHTDSPGLKLKLFGAEKSSGSSAGVEVYGNPIVATWTDRELSVAGMINVRRSGEWGRELFMLPKPAAVIPNLAIHLNREVNKGFEYNKQEHLKAFFPSGSILELISDELKVEDGDIGEGDLFLFDPFKGTVLSEKAFVSPRIDNLAMCHAVLESFLDAPAANGTQAAVFYDNEEVGSRTFQGADGSFFNELLERITVVTGGAGDDYYRAKAKSFMISADGAHALHPNFKDRHDREFAPLLNKGPVLKMNAGYSYATNSDGAAVFADICDRSEVAFQKFIGRSDIPSGGTIGAVSSSILGIRTIDVGNPMLAMHSIRETAGVDDHFAMIKVLNDFFKNGV